MSSADGAKGLCPLDSRPSSGHAKGALPPLWTPEMLRISHTGLGLNPGAELSGDILQDQRVWGSATWAFGSIGANLIPPAGVPGASHSDCVALNISLWMDGEELIRDGRIVHEELAKLAEGLV